MEQGYSRDPLLGRLEAALGRAYRIERELGAGGMATVYLAEDLKHHRKVAIKVLHTDLSATLGAERFLREIELTASLQHPVILPLFDSGDADGLLYYVMPYVEGESLARTIGSRTPASGRRRDTHRIRHCRCARVRAQARCDPSRHQARKYIAPGWSSGAIPFPWPSTLLCFAPSKNFPLIGLRAHMPSVMLSLPRPITYRVSIGTQRRSADASKNPRAELLQSRRRFEGSPTRSDRRQ